MYSFPPFRPSCNSPLSPPSNSCHLLLLFIALAFSEKKKYVIGFSLRAYDLPLQGVLTLTGTRHKLHHAEWVFYSIREQWVSHIIHATIFSSEHVFPSLSLLQITEFTAEQIHSFSFLLQYIESSCIMKGIQQQRSLQTRTICICSCPVTPACGV